MSENSYHHLGEQVDLVAAVCVKQVADMSEGAFRMGARAMRDAIESRVKGYDVRAAIVAADTPLPAFSELQREMPHARLAREGWAWWSGSNDEWFHNGPFATRDDAVAALDGEGGYIIEARKGVVARFSADRLIEAQYFEDNDGFDYDHTEPERIGGVDVVAAADAELQALLDGWLDRWRHTFLAPSIFAAARNAELIEAAWIADGPLSAEERAELVELDARAEAGRAEISDWSRRRVLRDRADHFAESAA